MRVLQMQQQTAASPKRTWRLIDIAWKKMLEAPANLGSQVVAWPPVASRMEASFERAKRSYQAHLPRLRDPDARIVEDLKTSGVSITALEATALEGAEARIVEGLKTSGVSITSLEATGLERVAPLVRDAYALVARHSPWTRSFQAN